jgi:aryl-alcohol dehydrogenase-like predicted oxidoreductase
MQLRPLGRTGVQVSPLVLGTMMFGAANNPDHDDAIRVVHRALDAGINVVDTADVYSDGESEEIVGKALKGRRDSVVLATKVGLDTGRGPNRSGSSRRWIAHSVENSLRRLGTDRIDLYQVHRWDPDTDHEETLGALTDLQRQGKIRYFGSSTYPAAAIVEARWAAERHGLSRFATEQPPYSILARGIEREVLPTTERHGMGVLVWSPLSGGWLSGRYRRGSDYTSRRAARMPARYDPHHPGNAAKLDAVERLALLAEEAGLSLIHLSLAFAIRHPGVTAAILGPRTIEQLEGQLGAADVVLPDDVLDRIDEIVPPGTTFNEADAGWRPAHLDDPSTRRRVT